jgi:hypothetical protein
MIREDNSGFVHFPIPNKFINRIDGGKTFVYLVAFDSQDLSNIAYELSNLRIIKPCDVVNDDISLRVRSKTKDMSVDELIKNNFKEEEFENMYFPSTSDEEMEAILSIPMTSCICLGWSEFTYEVKDDYPFPSGFWSASFRDLTNEGRKLYYSIKKLHNNKEVRLLTFNNI